MLMKTIVGSIGLLLVIGLFLILGNIGDQANADPWSTSFTDANGAVIEVYSDAAYTVRVDENSQLAANTNYFVQIKHPNMNLNSEGTNRNRMRLYGLLGTQTNFGNGVSEVTFTQQAGGPPYVYRATFRTPTSANVYGLEPDLRNNGQTKRAYVRGWKMTVGSTTSYVKTFSDAAYTQETDAFSASARVYMEVYGSGLTDGTPTTSATNIILSDFAGNQSSPSETVSKVSTRKYRVSFQLPGTSGDKGIQASISSGSVLARPDILIKIDNAAPVVSGVMPSGTVTVNNPTITASYTDASSGINSATAIVYLDGVVQSGCSATATAVSCSTSGLTNGPHTIGVSVKDFAGNLGTGSGSFTVSTDSTPPSVTNIQPSGTITTGSATISAYYNDSDSGVNTGTVAVTLNGIPVSSCSVGASSASCAVYGLGTGIYTIGVSVSDNLGNAGSGSGSFIVSDADDPIVDSVSANTSTISAAFHDPDPSSGINGVTVALDGTPLSGCSSGAGTVSCPTPAGLGYGSHAILVTVTDTAGNSGLGTGSLFIDDPVAPAISSIIPSGNQNSTGANVSVYYSDAESGIAVASVYLAIDGVPQTGCYTDASLVSCMAYDMAQGAHTIDVSVSDNAGNTSTGTGSFFVDTGWPTIGTIRPRNTNITTNAITATIGDPAPSSGINAGSIIVTFDGAPVSGCTLTGTALVCDPAITMAEGTHSTVITVTDNAGNVNTNSRTFSIDTAAPVVSNLLPGGTIIASDTTLSADLSDVGTGIKTSTAVVTLDGSPVSGCTISATAASCAVYGLADGTHSFTVSVQDNVTNTGTASGSFTVDAGAPSITSILPSGDLTTTDADVSVYYGDTGSGIAAASVYVSLNGADITSGCTVTAYYASCPRTGLGQGANVISASVADNSGNTASGSGSFFVDTKAPKASSIQPRNVTGGGYGSTSATITAYVFDVAPMWPVAANSGVNPATITVTLDGSPVSGCSLTATTYPDDEPLGYVGVRIDVPAQFVSCPAVTGLAQGNHTVVITEQDNFGNAGSNSRTFKVDTIAPDVTGLSPSGTIATGSTTLSASFSDGSGTGIKTSTAIVTLDGAPVSGCTVTAAGASCAVYGLADGAHSFNVSVKDNTGNLGSASGTFTVETCTAGKPSLSLAAPSAYWASYADYLGKKLSVTWTINNTGSTKAQNVQLTSSTPAYAAVICLLTMPAPVGDIAAGSSASVTVQYQLPPGFSGAGFRVANSASAEDCAGNAYLYGAQTPTP